MLSIPISHPPIPPFLLGHNESSFVPVEWPWCFVIDLGMYVYSLQVFPQKLHPLFHRIVDKLERVLRLDQHPKTRGGSRWSHVTMNHISDERNKTNRDSRLFLCGIHPRPCKENAGQGNFGVLKTSFSILKTSFSFLKTSFTIFENKFLHFWKDFLNLCLKTVFFCFFPRNLLIKMA